jgi:Flp pilus assembly CpaF family ATPase
MIAESRSAAIVSGFRPHERPGVTKRRHEIERLIDTVRPFLADPATFDILINPPTNGEAGCTVWVDTADGGLAPTELVLDPQDVRSLNRSIASELGRSIDEDHPILMGELPWDGSRVTALNYPITRHGPALCLRKPSSKLLTFDDYATSNALDGPAPARLTPAEPPPTFGHRAYIEYAIRAGWNIVYAGAPQAGKTTLMNAAGSYAREMAPLRRLYIIEDLEELRDEALPENVLRVQPSKALGITESDLLQVGLRVRPDGIVVAELLRPQAAYDFLAAMNTGVVGSYTTIHANSAHDALIRAETLIEQVPGIAVSPAMIASAIQLVVFVARLPNGRRRIQEVARVTGAHARGSYNLEYIGEDSSLQPHTER